METCWSVTTTFITDSHDATSIWKKLKNMKRKGSFINSATYTDSTCEDRMRWYSHVLVKTWSTYQSTTSIQPRRETTITIFKKVEILSEYSLKSPSSPKQQESGTRQRRRQQRQALNQSRGWTHSHNKTNAAWLFSDLWRFCAEQRPVKAHDVM